MSPLAVAKAYAAVAQQAKPQAPAPGAEGPDFAQLVNQAMGDTVSASKQAERAMQMHTQGRAELVDVVTSVASAQASLETVMAVRDQVISAYQEIMRMPI